ncbi:YihY/virulence factor BrkB family protein [Cellulomonas bogoriensis]|uniref:Uncharacterized protein n=1 Tax=Cellulomonas bogoriensis 69B4 = DSM 16987 TaxID=1386082 RepID=A0A0A0BZW0_9CELL|nr:YihY/virulence factor BrkB family protein [Cellulomonas bogoriensis]KGM13481.1 hypothetical protein N869_13680 [Cellulomonas bogoriensis 69B4 = DSM 16987]
MVAAVVVVAAALAGALWFVRARRRDPRPRRDPFEGAERLAARWPVVVAGYSLTGVVVQCWRRFVEVRVTGLAAEMTYFAMISVLPLVTALGAALGFLERVVGREDVDRIEQTVVDWLAGVFDQQLTADVLAPLVRGLLRDERAGVAVGSVAIALFLASRMFRAAIRALDDAYMVPERRTLVAQWTLGLGLALGAVITLVVLLTMLVIGPLLGGGQWLAEAAGQEEAYETAWATARWPLVAVVSALFLLVLYRYGPNARNTWWGCVPGALLGTAALVLVAFGFGYYLDVAGPAAPAVGDAGEAVGVAAQTIGAVLAAVLWLWLSSIVILTGGVLNAELGRSRRARGNERPGAGSPAEVP